MPGEPNAVEQAVSRTLRDNLGKIEQTATELYQAIYDLVSACASNRPTNALPPMIRAQTSAASLSATLEVLSRFVTTTAMQPQWRTPGEHIMTPAVPDVAHPTATSSQFGQQVEQPASAPAHPIQWNTSTAAPELGERQLRQPEVREQQSRESGLQEPQFRQEQPPQEELPAFTFSAADAIPPAAVPFDSNEPVPVPVHAVEFEAQPPAVDDSLESTRPEGAPLFSLDSLPPDQQELHKRAYRVAKVSMQDIKMLHPEDVRLGRENKDICVRLREDIDKARKEYDRRFDAVQFHSADYFYDWMVEILAGGNPEALGEYPYPSPTLHR